MTRDELKNVIDTKENPVGWLGQYTGAGDSRPHPGVAVRCILIPDVDGEELYIEHECPISTDDERYASDDYAYDADAYEADVRAWATSWDAQTDAYLLDGIREWLA